VRPGLDLLAALSYLVQGRADSFRAVFRAWRDFLGWHGELARKRRAIRASRRGIGRREYLPRVGSSALSAGTPDLGRLM